MGECRSSREFESGSIAAVSGKSAVGEIHNESENATTQSCGEVLLMSVVAVGSLIAVVLWQPGPDRKKIDPTYPKH